MAIRSALKTLGIVVTLFSLGTLFGCTGIEYNTRQDNYPYMYIHKELQEADRAVEAARRAGKDTLCPAEFKAAEDLRNQAFDVYKACRTQEAIGLARQATAKANALCPAQPVAVQEPPPVVPAAEPAPGRYKYCVTLDVEFDIDKTAIRPQYHDEVAKVGNFMKQYPDTTAIIEGHTDNVGTAEYNMDLSQRRAESVVSYLGEKFGIDRSRLVAKGYGLTRPVADNATNEGRQANRRIEAIIDCALVPKEVLAPARLCMGLQIEFDTGRADIKPQYRDEIAKVGNFMKDNPTTTALIEGHTDNAGSAQGNMKLSQQRADNVVAYLVENFGIDRSRLSAKGYGSTRQIAYNTTPEGMQKNRRINAVIDCVIGK